LKWHHEQCIRKNKNISYTTQIDPHEIKVNSGVEQMTKDFAITELWWDNAVIMQRGDQQVRNLLFHILSVYYAIIKI
jgi:hypothetical protein